jgi:hypothetical protein
MSEAQFWMIVTGIATSAMALPVLIAAVIGAAKKPFQGMREALGDAVSDIKGETSSIKTDLAGIKGSLRSHEEVLRDIQGGQRVIVESLRGVLPAGEHGIAKVATEGKKVLSIHAYRDDAEAAHG